jgi:hypothetical protein
LGNKNHHLQKLRLTYTLTSMTLQSSLLKKMWKLTSFCKINNNPKHSFSTPLLNFPSIANAIDPQSPSNCISDILYGNFDIDSISDYEFSSIEKEWFTSLQYAVTTPISLEITLEDFQHYFRHKHERTASSPSGRHMGHYKVMLECFRHNQHTYIPEIVVLISHMSLLTSSPLLRWEHASQVMIEKGKGRHIENLCIIQLCEADLNFILHIIWGKILMRKALHHLDKAQFAIPGQTCHNGFLNKLLYLDLSRQTLTPGLMLDYDAKAPFDRVISSIAITWLVNVSVFPALLGCSCTIYYMTCLLMLSLHLAALPSPSAL